MEVGVLRQLPKQYRLWTRLSDFVEKLSERSDIGRAFEEVERKKLIETAATSPRWFVAYAASVLVLSTTMRSGEIKGLCWKDVGLFKKTLTVKRYTTKTDAGGRVITLNRDAVWALSKMWPRIDGVNGV